MQPPKDEYHHEKHRISSTYEQSDGPYLCEPKNENENENQKNDGEKTDEKIYET